MSEDETDPFVTQIEIDQRSQGTSDPVKVEKAREWEKLDRDKELRDLRVIINTYAGRAFLWRVISRCKVFIGGHVAESNRLHFDNGSRTLGLWLIEEMFSADPNAYTMMRIEAEQRDREKQARERKKDAK